MKTQQEYIEQGEQYILKTYNRFPVVLEKGKGVYLYDADQKKYLDFLRAWLKDKEYVALAYMTGILPIKKVRITFCVKYVYRVFHDRSGGACGVFWIYRTGSGTALSEI